LIIDCLFDDTPIFPSLVLGYTQLTYTSYIEVKIMRRVGKSLEGKWAFNINILTPAFQ